MGKRILLFLAVNALIVVTILLVTNILGIRHYVTEQGIDYSALLVFSAIVGFTGALISLALSRTMAKWMLNVRVLSPDDPNLSSDERWLVEEVHRLAR
ncbi:MAG: protease HtpX, partial [Planifilum fulgidum]